MTGRTHIAFNTTILFALTGAGIILSHNPNAGDIAFIGGIMLGGLLPDIDNPDSKISRKLGRTPSSVDNPYQKFHHRRKFTHWPIFCLVTGMCLYGLTNLYAHPVFSGFFAGLTVGTLAHLFCDMFNPYGILLLAPFFRKQFHIIRIPVGSIGEIFFLVLSIASIFLVTIAFMMIRYLYQNH